MIEEIKKAKLESGGLKVAQKGRPARSSLPNFEWSVFISASKSRRVIITRINVNIFFYLITLTIGFLRPFSRASHYWDSMPFSYNCHNESWNNSHVCNAALSAPNGASDNIRQ